jgi:hypothetical protein
VTIPVPIFPKFSQVSEVTEQVEQRTRITDDEDADLAIRSHAVVLPAAAAAAAPAAAVLPEHPADSTSLNPTTATEVPWIIGRVPRIIGRVPLATAQLDAPYGGGGKGVASQARRPRATTTQVGDGWSARDGVGASVGMRSFSPPFQGRLLIEANVNMLYEYSN